MLVIMTPKPGEMDQLIDFAKDGAKHHLEVPACTKWLFSRQINSPDGEESLILIQEWTSVEELMAHSKVDYSVTMRDQIRESTTKFEFKMSKVFAGFDSKN
ncbi:hypothetical protein V499_01927 [Pseudogymnoascus sp. VKM F-103]|nr:hypothetical protein V499_01927 [Pseudogymnoascus sp. VKM F-103]